jgi:hypothetical protein
MNRKDPFRTLDDPDPVQITAEPIAAGSITGPRPWLGYWRAPAGRPGWLRRLIVWFLFGWRWSE